MNCSATRTTPKHWLKCLRTTLLLSGLLEPRSPLGLSLSSGPGNYSNPPRDGGLIMFSDLS